MAYVYSRNTAESRFEYAGHPHCYGYVYPPTGGWPGHGVPCKIIKHGGGWAQDDYDRSNERYPDRNRLARTDTSDQFRDGGGAVIVLEYPLGSALLTTQDNGPNATHFPDTWILAGRAVQYIKDQTEATGIFFNKIDPAQLVTEDSSAGCLTTLMGQWAPTSWGMFPRTPGKQVALGPNQYRNNHLVKGMVLANPPLSLAQMDPGRDSGTGLGFSPVARAVIAMWRYLISGTDPYGWNAMPQGHREAMSAILLLKQWTAQDLGVARGIPIWAICSANPTVQFNPAASLTTLLPNYCGADDSHDMMLLEYMLAVAGGFSLRSFWGDDAATAVVSRTPQTITGVTTANPIVITTLGPENGVQTGNLLKLGQITGVTAANGIRTATRISPTQFSIGVDGTGPGWGGGGLWCFHNVNGNYAGTPTAMAADIYQWQKNTLKLTLT